MIIDQTHSFTYGGVQYWGDTYGVMVEEGGLVVPDIPKLRLDIQPLGGGSGAVTQGSTYDPLMITIPCCVVSTETDRETQIAAVRAALVAADTAETTLILWWLSASANTYQVRRVGEVVFNRTLDGATFTLEFIAPNPVATGTAV